MLHFFSRQFALLILGVAFSSSVWAQKNTLPKNWSLGFQAHFGSFITSEPEAAYIRDSYASFVEASVRKQTDGSKPWHRANNYPQMGITLFYGNPGSRRYMGHLVGVLPFIHFPVVRSKVFKSGFRLGTGLAWIEKPYQVRTNHKNTLLGSSINYFISLMQENEVRITKTVSLNIGISFSHLSNSDIKMPNFGLNVPTASVGFRLKDDEIIHPTTTKATRIKTLDWRLFATAGTKQVPWVGSPHYVVPVLNGEVAKPLGASGVWGGGVVLQYDASLTSDPSGYALTKDKSENLQAGVHVFYERQLGALSLPVEAGFYLLNPKKGRESFQTLGIRYRMNRHWSFGFHLKTHTLQVDYTHAGIGYHF